MAATVVLLAALTACTDAGPDGSAPAPTTPGGGATSPSTPTQTQTPTPTTATPTPTPDAAERALAAMSLAQRVGQLVMVGTPAGGTGGPARAAISGQHVGNVMLTGRSARGVAGTAATTAALQRKATAEATGGARLFVATDQEGGAVQVLSGSGFSQIPAGTTQGGWSAAQLQSRAVTWGRQLHRAGVNVTLGPVADTVPASLGTANPPIGRFHRELGHTPSAVSRAVVAYDAGMQDAGIAVVPKHFPGLGLVRANTDTASRVTDSVTTTSSTSLQPFRAAVDAGTPFVMISNAVYPRIDAAHPACFSRAVITALLREQLGFDGVVISDDLGAAQAVQRWSPGSRAVQFVAAGGDVVLTVTPALAAPMARALEAKAKQSKGFRAQVDAAALRVLRAKDEADLLP